MAAQRSTAREVAAQVCKDNPDVPSRTLARQLRRDEPTLFASVEAARVVVRRVRGNHGASRRHLADAPRPNGKAGEVLLPEGKKQGLKPIEIPPGKALVMSDLHCPYHDEVAIQAAVAHAVKAGCDTLYLNGDIIDFYSISRWQKDPRERDLPSEIKTTHQLLEALAAPFARKYYKCGNHDERWDLYIFQRAEDLVGVEGLSLQEVLKLHRWGYQFIESKQWAWMGKLPVLHGHEFVAGLSSPVNPARGLWNKLTDTALCGHLHRSSHHSETHSMTKQAVSCWSCGCMCDLSPSYAPLNKWNLGFALVEWDKKAFTVENFKLDAETKEIWRA